MNAAPDRTELLEQYGAAYGRESFFIVWTEGVAGDDAKRTLTSAWPRRAKPLPAADGGAFAAALFARRGQTKNPAVTVRLSRLIVVECDTPEGLAQVEALGLPTTWTVRSSAAHRQHRYYRWPRGVDPIKVSFRFEPVGVIADREHYYLLPPALHPSGSMYAFLFGLGPDDLPIAELPYCAYEDLLRLGKATETGSAAVSLPMSLSPTLPDGLRGIPDARSEAELEQAIAAGSLFARASAYAHAALADQCAQIRAAQRGSRHTTINRAAYIVGGFVDSPARAERGYVPTGLSHNDATKGLAAAARDAFGGYLDERTGRADGQQSIRTIERGLAAGEALPRQIPERAA